MEELTIKEKAKRYDEAIERAEKWRNAPNVDKIPTFANRVIDEIFPEFEENEDERIRKEIINFLELPHPQFVGKRDHKTWITWLEKQGEKNTAWSEVDNFMYNRIKNLLTDISLAPESINSLFDWLKSLKFRVQSKQEWSEEDKKMIDSIYISLNSESVAEGLRCCGIKHNADDLETILFKQKRWLKSIRPQQKQEWNEEDEKMLNNLITLIRSGTHFAYEEEIAWLKSLSPKNHWKPSEEMLEALDIAIRAGIQLGSWEEKALRELQKQLKAL